jgi:L-aminopeptidase/D-esterase-like protein
MSRDQNRGPTRREVLIGGFAAAAAGVDYKRSLKMTQPSEASGAGAITDVAGIKVGHFTDSRRPTGCTVIICEEGAVGGVDVRGSAPGTRETDLLNPINVVQQVHAVVLSGGSAFGLDTATGVIRRLEELGVGYETRYGRVPIVPAAILFDLGVGDPKIRPDAEAGYKACKAAIASPPAEGNIGAGAGATIGKLYGMDRAMKGGVGTASIRTPGGLVVGAIVAVNAAGDVVDPKTGAVIAGARAADGKRVQGTMASILRGDPLPPSLGGTNTTIGVVATDAALDKAQAAKVAQMAHDGLARTISPAHTMVDGDTIFALATGKSRVATPANVTLIGALAAEAMAQAVVRAVRAARGISGYPSVNELPRT